MHEACVPTPRRVHGTGLALSHVRGFTRFCLPSSQVAESWRVHCQDNHVESVYMKSVRYTSLETAHGKGPQTGPSTQLEGIYPKLKCKYDSEYGNLGYPTFRSFGPLGKALALLFVNALGRWLKE